MSFLENRDIQELINYFKTGNFLKSFKIKWRKPTYDSGFLYRLMKAKHFLYPIEIPRMTLWHWETKSRGKISFSSNFKKASKKRINEHYYIYEIFKDLVVLQDIYEKKIAKKITEEDKKFLIEVFKYQFKMSDYPEREIREALLNFEDFKKKMFAYLKDKMSVEQKQRIEKLDEMEFFLVMKESLVLINK